MLRKPLAGHCLPLTLNKSHLRPQGMKSALIITSQHLHAFAVNPYSLDRSRDDITMQTHYDYKSR